MKVTLWEKLFGSKSKSRSRARISTRTERDAIAHTITAERLQQILRSAENGNVQDLFDLFRDVVTSHGHTLTELSKRKLAVLSEAERFFPKDKNDPAQVLLADHLGEHLPQVKGWSDSMIHLLDSTIYPVSLVEKIYRPARNSTWAYELDELRPVPYRLFDYTYGYLRIEDADDEGNCLGTYHDADPIRYVIHRGHLLRSHPDTWGGPMRAILFWWLFATMGRDWWARFLDRFGSPFLEGTYNKSDDESRYLLQRAFSSATRLMGIVVPDDTAVKIHQVNTQGGGDAFEAFHSVANQEISKIIVGQTLSAQGQNLGLGGGQASVQENVREDIRQFDSLSLAATVQNEIIGPLLRFNGILGTPAQVAWGGSDEETISVSADVLSAAREAGLELTDEGLSTFNKVSGLEFQRSAAPSSRGAFSLAAPASQGSRDTKAKPPQDAREAVDQLAENAAPDFAEAMGKTLSPLREAVLAATSISDLEKRIAKQFPNLDHSQAIDLAQEALVTASLNAADNFPEAK